MASAGTVVVDFAAETAKFVSELKKVNSSLKSMESGFKSIETVAKGALGFLSISAIAGFAKGVFTAANELDRLQQKTGIAVESLSRLQFVAGQTDVEFQSLTTAVTQLQKRIGNGEAVNAIERLGLSFEQIRNLSPDAQLIEISRGFQTITDPAKRVSTSMELFGKAGADLLPFLLTGPEAIAKLSAESDKLGATLDASTVAALDRTEKQVNKLKAALSGLTAEVLAGTSILIFGPEEKTQFQQFTAIVQRRVELQETLARLQNPTAFQSILITEGQRAKAIEETNKQLAANAALIADIQEKEKQRILTSQQAKQIAGGSDISEFAVNAQRVRVPGSPDNLDELMQDVNDKTIEDLNKTILDGTRKAEQQLLELQQQSGQQLLSEIQTNAQNKFEAEEFWRNEDLQADERANAQKLASQKRVLNAGLGLLQAFAGHNRKAAIALIAINKGLSIARAIQNTSVGVTAALALGPVLGPPLAAKIKLMGAIEVATIAATGFAESGSVGSGGAAIGSAANPAFTNPANTSFDNEAGNSNASGKTINVILNGNLYNTDDFKKTIEHTLKELDDVDTVIFSGNGAQAQRIRNGA